MSESALKLVLRAEDASLLTRRDAEQVLSGFAAETLEKNRGSRFGD